MKLNKGKVIGNAAAVFTFAGLAAVFSLVVPSQKELLLAGAYAYGVLVHARLAGFLAKKIK